MNKYAVVDEGKGLKGSAASCAEADGLQVDVLLLVLPVVCPCSRAASS
jgi:hypothetical protein